MFRSALITSRHYSQKFFSELGPNCYYLPHMCLGNVFVVSVCLSVRLAIAYEAVDIETSLCCHVTVTACSIHQEKLIHEKVCAHKMGACDSMFRYLISTCFGMVLT